MAVLATNCQETETARRGRRSPQQSQATSILLTLSPPSKTNHATKKRTYGRRRRRGPTAPQDRRRPVRTSIYGQTPLQERFARTISSARRKHRVLVVSPSVSQSTYLPEITTVALQCRRRPHCTHHSRHVNIIIIYNVCATIRGDFVTG